MSNIKLHNRATVIYACKQKARGSRVTIPKADVAGTISVTGATVTGTSTQFTTQATEGAYIYDKNGAEIGRILTINSDTSITLYEAVVATSIAASPTTTLRAGVAANTAETPNIPAINTTGAHAYSFGLGNANAVRVREGLKFTFETETSSATYVGDELDRYEQTWVKDEFVTVEMDTFVPILGVVTDSANIQLRECPLPDLYQACGLGVVLPDNSSSVDYTNTISSGDVIEVEFRLSSPDLVEENAGSNSLNYNATEKVYFAYDLIGQLDFDIADIGERATYKFMFKGNASDIAILPRRVPDYASQSSEIAEPFNSSSVNSNIQLVALELIFAQKKVTFGASGTIATSGQTLSLGGLTFTASANVTVAEMTAMWSGLPANITAADANVLKASELSGNGSFTDGALTGYYTKGIPSNTTSVIFCVADLDTNINTFAEAGTLGTATEPTAIILLDPYAYRTQPTASNLCIGKLSAPNVTGRDIQRFKMSCETGFYQGAATTDISITVKEDIEGIFFQPNKYISVEGILWVSWGRSAYNSLVTLKFSKVAISKVTPGTIGNFRAFDVTLRNIGQYTMTLS